MMKREKVMGFSKKGRYLKMTDLLTGLFQNGHFQFRVSEQFFIPLSMFSSGPLLAHFVNNSVSQFT